MVYSKQNKNLIFKNITHKFSDITLALAAGIMLAAAIFGLIIPSADNGSRGGIFITVLGITVGALLIFFIDMAVERLEAPEINSGRSESAEAISGAIPFVIAIAIHNIPEGIAAGVGFGSDSISDAIMIAGGIALQNIPEGMVVISPLLSLGMRSGRAFFLAALTGAVEVAGVIIGYYAVSIASVILPFALAFAGGTMLYVICDEMIPKPRLDGAGRGATFAFLFGFCLMLAIDAYLS